MGEWHVHSDGTRNVHELFAPDGQLVGRFQNLEDARQAMRDLQLESLRHRGAFFYRGTFFVPLDNSPEDEDEGAY